MNSFLKLKIKFFKYIYIYNRYFSVQTQFLNSTVTFKIIVFFVDRITKMKERGQLHRIRSRWDPLRQTIGEANINPYFIFIKTLLER